MTRYLLALWLLCAPAVAQTMMPAVKVVNPDGDGLNAFADVSVVDFWGAWKDTPAAEIWIIIMPGTFEPGPLLKDGNKLTLRLWGSREKRYNPSGVGLDAFRYRPHFDTRNGPYWAVIGLRLPNETWEYITVAWDLPEIPR